MQNSIQTIYNRDNHDLYPLIPLLDRLPFKSANCMLNEQNIISNTRFVYCVLTSYRNVIAYMTYFTHRANYVLKYELNGDIIP